jgi:hypothetical protein
MAAKRAMQAITHATGMKYDCPIVIMPIKSRNPVNFIFLFIGSIYEPILA